MADREAHLQIAVGGQSSGKTHTTKQQIKIYPAKQGRPVLIFDNNGEYSDFPALEYDIGIDSRAKRSANLVKLGKTNKIARILGLKKNKQPMSMAEKKETLITIGEYFPKGLVVLEDVNNYEKNFDSGEVLSTIVNFRHKGGGAGVDCIAHFQSIQILRGILMANAKYIRMHFTQDDPVKIKQRLSNNYMNIQLGYLTTKRNYLKALRHLREKGKSIDDYKQILSKNLPLNGIDTNIANLAFYSCLIGIGSPAFYNISELDMKESLKEYYTNYEKLLPKMSESDGNKFIDNVYSEEISYFLK